MEVFNPNGINIYNLSGGKSLPDFLSERKRKDMLRRDVKLRRRIELIQDFQMPTVCTRICPTKDGQHVYIAGTYKPRIKCYDFAQLSLKFERCLDAEIVDFKVISDDYSKIVLLGSDRSLEFHTPQGKHYKVRVPKFGRELSFYPANSELLIGCSSNEVYRMSLEEGRFMNPYSTGLTDITSIATSDDHHLVSVGGSNGMLECWDPRARSCIGFVQAPKDDKGHIRGVSKVKYINGLKIGVGTEDGRVILYDLRQTRPLVVKDHMYEHAINEIHFNADNGWIISTCKQSMKIWDHESGKPITAVEPPAAINHSVILENTGLAFLALEQEKMQSYFLPSLGPAPRWCSFLDNLTEELEENETDTLYDDYKFLTLEELKTLSLDSLIGTNILRAYMHGYFIDNRLYQKAKVAADPFEHETFVKEQIDKNINEEAKRKPVIKKVKVNQEMVEKVGSDSRFSAMFEDTEYAVDEDSERARLLKPVMSAKKTKRQMADTDDEDESGQTSQVEAATLPNELFSEEKASKSDSDSMASESDESESEEEKPIKQVKTKKMAIRSGVNFSSVHGGPTKEKLMEKRHLEENVSLSKRVRETKHSEVTHVKGGKVFTMEREKSSKDTEIERKKKHHMKERRKTTRNAEGLLKKQRPSGYQKGFKK